MQPERRFPERLPLCFLFRIVPHRIGTTMHASFLESLLLATFGDVLNQQVLPKLSQQLAAELKIPDTGCTQWLQLAEHRKQWTSLVRDCNRRLILHPMASQEPATAESEFYTASAPSAVELAFTVAEGILDDCSTELEQHQAGEIPAEQLIAAIANAIPAFDPNDVSIVYARLEREFVILSAGTEPAVVEADYAEPMFKNELAYLFGVDRVTIARRIASSELRQIPGTLPKAKKVRIHGDDFPPGLRRPSERKLKLSTRPKDTKRQ